MIKESIHQGDVTILNVYAPNNRVSKYTKRELMVLKGEIAKSIIIVGVFKSFPIHKSYNHYRETQEGYRRSEKHNTLIESM